MAAAPHPAELLEKQSLPEQTTRIHTYDAFKCHWYAWQICGLKFPENPKWKLPYIVYAVILNLTVTIAFPLSLIINCFLFENFIELCENLYVTVSDVICNLKFINVFLVRKKLLEVRKILDKLDVRVVTEDEIRVLRVGMRSANKCFYICGVIYGCYFVTTQLVVYMAKDRVLMFPAWLPFDWRNSYKHFIMAYLYQVYGLIVQAIQDLGNDTYPQAYLRILCAHMEVLSLRISKLGKNKQMDCRENYKDLVNCIKDHHVIIELQEIIQEIISTACLAQFLCTGLAQCTIGVYMLYLGMDYSKMLSSMILFVAVTLEILILCHFGDQLCQRGEELSTAVYSCNWMDQNNQFKVALKLLLMRSHKPVTIMAGNVIPVQLPTFVKVIKTAYSTFAVLSEIK